MAARITRTLSTESKSKMNEQDSKTSKSSRFRFSIASLAGLTALVAVHLAVPSLVSALKVTLYMAALLALLIFPLAISADRLSHTNTNKLMQLAKKTYFVLLGITYFVTVAFAIVIDIQTSAGG